MYLNSYLATLNAREWLREKIEEPVSIHLSDISARFTSTQSQSVPRSPTVYEKVGFISSTTPLYHTDLPLA